MDSKGWIKLHREVFESDIWNDVTTFRLFIYLIGRASHKDGLKYKGMTLQKGQFVRSYRKLADDLSYKDGRGYKKYSLSTIKSCVNKLIKSERVNVKETELGTLFTIVNYAKYQHLDDAEKETQNASNEEVRTNTERSPNEVRTNTEQEEELKNLKNLEEEEEDARREKENPFMIYEQNFGMLKPILQESFIYWCEDMGDDVVIAAMKLAAQKGGRTFGYIEEILKEWANAGLKGINQVRAHELEKRNKKNNTIPFRPKKAVGGVDSIDWDNL